MANGVNNNKISSNIELPALDRARNRRDETISELAEGCIPQEVPTAGVGITVTNRTRESLNSRLITQNMDEVDRFLVYATLEGIPPEDLEDFLRQANSLITPDMTEHQKCGVISALAKVQGDRENFVRQALSLITQHVSTQEMNGEQKSVVISNLSKIESEEDREDFVRQVWSLITPEMDENQKFLSISFLAAIPTTDRSKIMREIVSIPIRERLRHLERAYMRLG